MPKHSKFGKCVLCLKDPIQLTKDHVFPKSWYPDTTSNNMYKWQIPTCQQCNSSYGTLENDLLIRLGLCIDPETSASSGIVPKVLRALDPSCARNDIDRRKRQAKLNEINSQTLTGENCSNVPAYPGLEEKWGRSLRDQIAILIPYRELCQLTEKIVRGIFYFEDKRFIEPPYRITFNTLDEKGSSEITALLKKFGKTYAREPGITVCRAVLEDLISSLFKIEIWSKIKMYALVKSDTHEFNPEEAKHADSFTGTTP